MFKNLNVRAKSIKPTEAGLNIENMVNKSKKNMAYTMLDATGAVDARLSEKLSSIPAIIRVRIL